MNKNPKAFVLMPFEPEFNSIYKDLIKPALEDAGYEVARADSFFDQQNILRDIVQGITTAQLIVADLTTLNPNVLYELGLCHGLQIPTILLAQSIEEVPFDLRAYKILFYSPRFDQVRKLKGDLKEIGERHRAKKVTFGSPITDFLPANTTVTGKVLETLPEEQVAGVSEEVEEEKGFLDFIVEGSQAAEEMARIMIGISEATEDIASKMNSHTARLHTLAANPGPGTASQVHKISLAAAIDMNQYSEYIEKDFPTLEKSMELMTENFSGYVTWLQPKTEEDKKQVAEFRKTVSGLLEGTRQALKNIRLYRDTVAGLKGISREINRASRRMTHALDGLLAVMEMTEAFCARTLPLLDEKLRCRPKIEGDTDA